MIDFCHKHHYNKNKMIGGIFKMEENEKFSAQAEQLKNETKDTVNQVKDTIKNVDFKKDTEETKGFLKEMFVNPFGSIKKIASGEENFLKKAFMIMIVFILAKVVCKIISLIKYGKYAGLGDNILGLVASFLNPIFYIVVPAVVILMINKLNKKSLTTIISTLIATQIPIVINSVIDIVEGLISGITIISSPISTALSAISVVFMYFGMRNLFEEEKETFVKKFVVIEVISSFVLVILARIGIY